MGAGSKPESAHRYLSGLGHAALRGPGEQHQGGEVEQGHRENGRHEVRLRDSRGAGVQAAGPAHRDGGGGGGAARPQRGLVAADGGVGGQREEPAEAAAPALLPLVGDGACGGAVGAMVSEESLWIVRVEYWKVWSGVEKERGGLVR